MLSLLTNILYNYGLCWFFFFNSIHSPCSNSFPNIAASFQHSILIIKEGFQLAKPQSIFGLNIHIFGLYLQYLSCSQCRICAVQCVDSRPSISLRSLQLLDWSRRQSRLYTLSTSLPSILDITWSMFIKSDGVYSPRVGHHQRLKTCTLLTDPV